MLDSYSTGSKVILTVAIVHVCSAVIMVLLIWMDKPAKGDSMDKYGLLAEVDRTLLQCSQYRDFLEAASERLVDLHQEIIANYDGNDRDDIRSVAYSPEQYADTMRRILRRKARQRAGE